MGSCCCFSLCRPLLFCILPIAYCRLLQQTNARVVFEQTAAARSLECILLLSFSEKSERIVVMTTRPMLLLAYYEYEYCTLTDRTRASCNSHECIHRCARMSIAHHNSIV